MPPSTTPMQQIPATHEANTALISAFSAHPAFATQQAARSGKIYFMWDFATRTDAMFKALLHNYPPPDTPATRGAVPNVPPACMSEKQREELREDAVGRCMMLWSMIGDTSGMTEMMFQEEKGKGVDVGEEVRKAAKAVHDAIS